MDNTDPITNILWLCLISSFSIGILVLLMPNPLKELSDIFYFNLICCSGMLFIFAIFLSFGYVCAKSLSRGGNTKTNVRLISRVKLND